MLDPDLSALLACLDENDLGALLVLSDFLEERGDRRAADLRRLHGHLYDDWLFAPQAFEHFNLVRRYILPFFPEYEEGS